jgi:hypothetical protein
MDFSAKLKRLRAELRRRRARRGLARSWSKTGTGQLAPVRERS